MSDQKQAAEALRAACVQSEQLTPMFEKLKETSDSTVDAALALARQARRTSPSGQMRAVAPPRGELTGKFTALK